MSWIPRTRPTRTGREVLSVPVLQQEADRLTAMQQQYGAAEIPQNKPGVVGTLIDLLSRPNYALAGFAEEVFGEAPSVTRGVKRALGEIFSGVGGIEGKKRAFGEVLENLGVGTITLADAFPALEGTWVGKFGTRGAAGIALDIVTDPLSYMSFGAKGVLVGKHVVNRAGNEAFQKLLRPRVAEAVAGIDRLADPIAFNRYYSRAMTEAEKEFANLYVKGGKVVDEFVVEGGAKLFGKKIPGTDKIGGAVGATLRMLPDRIVEPVVKGANEMHGSMKRTINALFARNGELANLPPEMRVIAERLADDFRRGSTAHRNFLMTQWDELAVEYRKLEKSDPGIGKRWHDVREQIIGREAFKSAEEAALYDRTMKFYDELGDTLVAHGALDPSDIRSNYIYHVYKNQDQILQHHPKHQYRQAVGTDGRFTKKRSFDTTKDAVEWSQEQHNLALKLMSREEAAKYYPVLEPEYDVMKNLEEYINQHSSVLARKAFREEMAQQLGKTLDDLGGTNIDDVMDALESTKLKAAKVGLPEGLEKEPLRQVIREGQVEENLVEAFGREGAAYTLVKSAITNNESVYLPKAVLQAIESFDSPLFNTKDYPAVGKMLRNFDWLNNTFKWGVYTLWPASLTRDGYSNLFLSGLRIGLAAVDPKRHMDAIRMMAGRELGREFATSGYTLKELRDLSKTFGVWVPGTVFAEQAGKKVGGRRARKIIGKRAAVENEARVLLWLEEIRRGADPRTAADTVAKFLFNYGEVSRVERDLFRRLIPFYTFTRKNVERQWKTLANNPGLWINQIKPFRGRTSENEMMVSFEADALKIRLDRDGKTLTMLSGIDLPQRNLDQIWAGGVEKSLSRLFGMVAPMIKAPLEAVIFNKDTFTGRDLTRAESGSIGRLIEMVNMPKGVRDWMGYSKNFDDNGRPRYTFDGMKFHLLFKSWAFSRAVTTADRVFREYITSGDPQKTRAFLDFFTGIRPKEMDLTEQQSRRLKQTITELEKSLVRRGVLRNYKSTYQPKDSGDTEF